jgi:biotin carboxyl carrier protein
MSGPREELQAIENAADDLVPALAARLEEHGLGEIEVRRGDLRIRLTATAADPAGETPGPGVATPSSESSGAAGSPGHRSTDRAPTDSHPDGAARTHPVTAPAVGYFIYADGLGPGLAVEKDDALGSVDMLGVRHDVRAPRAGIVHSLVTETGEAVEYGQLLIELEVSAG